MGGDDYDFTTGAVTFAAPYARPYDWTRAGIDGLFSDFSDTAVAARNDYLKELGR